MTAEPSEPGRPESPAPGPRPVVFHDDYALSILMEPDGTLRKVLRVSGVDNADFTELSRRNVVENARLAVDGEARAAEWEARLHQLRTTMQPLKYRTVPPGAAPDQPETLFCTATPIPAADGTLDSILLETEDRTTALRVDAERRESERRFRALAEALPQMVWVSNANGHVVYFSPQWTEFTGRTSEELLGVGFLDLVHPEDRALVHSQRRDDGQYRAVTFRLRRRDGEYRWMEADYRVISDDAGRPVRSVGGTTDITERRAQEDAAREQEEQLRVALAVTGLGRYALYFREDRITGDARMSEIFGVDVPDLVRREGLNAMFTMLHLEDVDRVRRAVQSAAAGGPDYDVEYRLWRRTPELAAATELRWVAARGRVEFDADGPVRMVGVIEDITERRGEEDTRLQWQRREAIGTLAGGVAHDFNNVISAILSNAALAERELGLGLSPSTSITEITRGAERAAAIVQRLLAFSREEGSEEPGRAPFDVGAVVREACSLVASSLPAGVTLGCDVEPGLPPILGSSTDLHRVVVNLLTNAGHAMQGRTGQIAVRCDRAGAPEEAAAAGAVSLTVEDAGHGIPEPVIGRIFEPFFTTKPAGKGTGLGLAASRTIVGNHGGTIGAENVPDGGARFTVVLPAWSDLRAGPPAPESESSRDPAPPSVGARVVFVDDEAPLVLLAERALPSYGHTVRAFQDPIAALDAIATDPTGVDALVTDLSMPGMSGLNLIDAVRAMRPGLPVVLSSGFLTTANLQEAERQGVDAIVPKPCSIGDLAAALEGVLGTGRAGASARAAG